MAILPGIIWLGNYENMHCAREIGFILNILDARSNAQL
jgi:hypothetical protein